MSPPRSVAARRPCLRYRAPPCEADANMRRILRAIALLITCGATVPIATAGTVLASFLFLPLPAVLPKPKAVILSKPTHVHLLDGTEIAVFKDVEPVYPVNQEDIPPVMKKAVSRPRTATSTSMAGSTSGAAS